MKRLVVLALAAACSAQQPKPTAVEGSASQPASPANPAAAKAAGTPDAAPPAAGQPGVSPIAQGAGSAVAQAKVVPPAIDASAMDKSVDPCTNFYQYSCGGWLKATPIPEDRALWGRGFS